jgi:hypothetical protein
MIEDDIDDLSDLRDLLLMDESEWGDFDNHRFFDLVPWFPRPPYAEEQVEMLKRFIKMSSEAIRTLDKHSRKLGHICIAWAALDKSIDDMFPLLLGCSEAHAACILAEKIGTRCEQLKKLLHLSNLDHDWTEWACALLARASGELAPLRNRYVHDLWQIQPKPVRLDRRAKIRKPQSHQKAEFAFNTEYPTGYKELERLSTCISTVSTALGVATESLQRWRAEGLPPALDPQWSPACKPNAQCPSYVRLLAAPGQPLVPSGFSFETPPDQSPKQ